MKKGTGIDRRSFIKKSTAGLFGGGLFGRRGFSRNQEKSETDSPRIKEYRTLGRTGFKVSDLATGDFDDPGPFRGLLDAGVNYIDTSIRRIGKEGATKEGFIRRAHRVMDALQIDYLDCLMLSSPETVEMLKTPGFHEATEQLKKEGKIRFVGVSHHGSQWMLQKPKVSMGEMLLAAAEV